MFVCLVLAVSDDCLWVHSFAMAVVIVVIGVVVGTEILACTKPERFAVGVNKFTSKCGVGEMFMADRKANAQRRRQTSKRCESLAQRAREIEEMDGVQKTMDDVFELACGWMLVYLGRCVGGTLCGCVH